MIPAGLMRSPIAASGNRVSSCMVPPVTAFSLAVTAVADGFTAETAAERTRSDHAENVQPARSVAPVRGLHTLTLEIGHLTGIVTG